MTSIKWLVALLLTATITPLPAQKAPPLGPNISTTETRAPAATPPTSATPGAILTAQDADAWLDGYLPYALKTGDIAGAVVAVVKDGRIVTERGYGYADVAKRTPVDPRRTLFRVGSVSKLLTWTAVMQQVEAGKIDLDADVNRYLDFKIPTRAGKPVTMRELMQHVAGFEEQGKGIMSTDVRDLERFDVLLKRSTPERILAPGTTPAYSNYGASLAGYIVERVSGEPFDSYMERHIFAPLDMRKSTFRQPLPKQLLPLMSQGYSVASEKPTGFEFVGPSPAGSMSSSAEDMAHFMIAHLQDGAYNGKRILSAATAEQMHNSPLTLVAPLNRMELGFFETNINGREVVGHLGDTQNFHTSLHLFLKDGIGLYVSFNSLGKAGAAGGLRTALFTDFADRYLPGSRTRTRVDVATAAKHAKMMAGTWINSRRAESNFFVATELLGQLTLAAGPGGTLEMPMSHGLNGAPRRWVEVAPFLWEDAESHERLAAQVVDGKAVRFSLDSIAPFMVFDRVPWWRNTTWLLPLLYIALAALAITAIFWPIAALVRRRYGATLALAPRPLIAYRASRVGAWAILLAFVAWGWALTAMLGSINNLNKSFDGVLWLVQILAVIAFFGGFAAMAWNAWTVWRNGARRWPTKTWSIVLLAASLVVLWVAIAFHLVDLGTNY